MSAEPATPPPRPSELLAAVGVVAAQALAVLGFGVWLLVRRAGDDPSNEAVFGGSAAYMFVFALLLGVLAVALWRRRGWSYGAAVFAQLLGLAVTYEMARGEFWVGAVPLGLASVGALVSLLSPANRAALGRS